MGKLDRPCREPNVDFVGDDHPVAKGERSWKGLVDRHDGIVRWSMAEGEESCHLRMSTDKQQEILDWRVEAVAIEREAESPLESDGLVEEVLP